MKILVPSLSFVFVAAPAFAHVDNSLHSHGAEFIVAAATFVAVACGSYFLRK